MDDASRPVAEQYQDSTRWLLVVLVVVSVLAAGVVAVADVPDLVGRRWQVVGAASAALTVLALLVAVYVVLRALDPAVEEDSIAAAEANDRLPAAAPDPEAAADDAAVIDVSDGALGGAAVDEPVADGARRTQRQAASRFRRARSAVGAAVVVAFLGMTGMTVAAVADGNNIEDRQRRALEAELALEEDGPITDPQAVGVQLTTRGLERVAEAMGCTGQDIGLRGVQGWAVSGTFRDPTVVLFGPVAACDDIQIALAPRDGFVYPTAGVPAAVARPATSSTTTTAPGAAATPTTAPAAPAAP